MSVRDWRDLASVGGFPGAQECQWQEQRAITARYRFFRLVHFEEFGNICGAIAREKKIKGWRREKKILMIERGNPTWLDLAERLPGKGGMGGAGSRCSPG